VFSSDTPGITKNDIRGIASMHADPTAPLHVPTLESLLERVGKVELGDQNNDQVPDALYVGGWRCLGCCVDEAGAVEAGHHR
jgi:hypothetical protein